MSRPRSSKTSTSEQTQVSPLDSEYNLASSILSLSENAMNATNAIYYFKCPQCKTRWELKTRTGINGAHRCAECDRPMRPSEIDKQNPTEYFSDQWIFTGIGGKMLGKLKGASWCKKILIIAALPFVMLFVLVGVIAVKVGLK